ncbi:hypothetical protein DSO57_1026908 [Entomophthora muscae]|uniref:Uncharacterized protein n=1 Tax=Entomophthora muscae TaxID=34485 RepID=A0ACC2RGJ3_9FUNG|nr:hypothetical protein DSO57_1026908 [Entomophthora muscae]
MLSRMPPPVEKYPPGSITPASFDAIKNNFVSAFMPFCPTQKIAGRECICKMNYPFVKYIEDEDTGTQAIVAINRQFNQIVVSYRLTTNLQNWLDNFNMQLVDVAEMPRGVRVHRGIYSNFVASYLRVQDTVIELLDDPRYQNHTLFITGYSLGGGMAQLSTSSWFKLLKTRNDTRPIEVISYANPRVGNAAFAQHMESLNIPITRYTNGKDLVSHIPGRKLGFVHAGAEVYGTSSKIGYFLRNCSQEFDEDPSCILSAFGKRTSIDHMYPFGKLFPLPPYC